MCRVVKAAWISDFEYLLWLVSEARIIQSNYSVKIREQKWKQNSAKELLQIMYPSLGKGNHKILHWTTQRTVRDKKAWNDQCVFFTAWISRLGARSTGTVFIQTLSDPWACFKLWQWVTAPKESLCCLELAEYVVHRPHSIPTPNPTLNITLYQGLAVP